MAYDPEEHKYNRATLSPMEQAKLFPDEPSKVPPMVYVLNEGQQNALDWLVDFCLGKTSFKRVSFQGYAGTGKTFTLNRMVEAVRKLKPEITFGMTAPTHKAVRVLKRHSELKRELDFGTIHSFLALKQKINQTTGEVSFEPDYSGEFGRKIDKINVLIVDESSMLHDSLFGFLEEELNTRNNLRIIYTGDGLQINPVMSDKEKKARGGLKAIPFLPAHREKYKIHMVELTEPQRQAANSPIIMYAHAIRAQHKNQSISFEFKEEYKHALEVVPRTWPVLEALFKQYFDSAEFQEDPDYVKVLCWRNSQVNWFNDKIRKMIYKDHSEEVLPKLLHGEKVLMDEAFIKAEKAVLPNNEEVVVINPKVIDFPVKYNLIENVFGGESKEAREHTFKVYACELETPEKFKYSVVVLHEDSQADYDCIRESIKQAAFKAVGYERSNMWKEFYKIQNRFAWIKYNYALTAHTSQGSSYDYCFSVEFDMNNNRNIEERNSLKYVAATRPRTKLFLIQ